MRLDPKCSGLGFVAVGASVVSVTHAVTRISIGRGSVELMHSGAETAAAIGMLGELVEGMDEISSHGSITIEPMEVAMIAASLIPGEGAASHLAGEVVSGVGDAVEHYNEQSRNLSGGAPQSCLAPKTYRVEGRFDSKRLRDELE